MPNRFAGLVLAVAVAASPTLASAPESPSLRQVLERLAQYVSAYAAQMSLVIGTEHYTQEVADGSGSRSVRPSPAARGTRLTRRLVSEFAIVRADDDWLGFRDVYEVDGAPVRDRTDRLRTLFLESPSNMLAQCRRIADESSRYNIGSIQRNFNTPTTALFFFHQKNQDRFRFKKTGEETVGGVLAWRIDYEERHKPTIIRTPLGKNVPATGSAWIDPASGRVFRTTLALTAEVAEGVKTDVIVNVSYAADDRLGMLVPAEMDESYVRLEGQPTTAHATYSDFKRFETDTKVIIR